MPNAVIISIGNELLSGRTVNSNATYIGGLLYQAGIVTTKIVTIRDEGDAIRDALLGTVGRYAVVILTGGLGPTHDDITKKIISEHFDSTLVLNNEVLDAVTAIFAKRGRELPAASVGMAMVPDKAAVFINPVGTAPGLHFTEGGSHIFCLPGVPREMKALMNIGVLPALKALPGAINMHVHLYRTIGIGESKLFELIEELIQRHEKFELAFLPQTSGVDIRVSDRSGDAIAYAPFHRELTARIEEYIYSTEDKSLAEVIGDMLSRQHKTVGVAESCSGGLIQDSITDVPGSSAYFAGGFVTYSNTSKMEQLNVQQSSLLTDGAVSETVACEMAAGARERLGTDIAVSSTGIAGPAGATQTKPIGLVYIGIATAEHVYAQKFLFGNDRRINKERTAQAALDMLRRELIGGAGGGAK